MRRFRLLAIALTFGLCAVASADVVVFNNGDQLTGTITSMEKGKLTITTKVAGETKVDLKDVKTFSSDGPIEIRLNDGTIIHQKVNTSDAGMIALDKTGPLEPQKLPIGQVESINPKREMWEGALAIGGSLQRGNTDMESLDISFDAVRRGLKDRVTADAGYHYSREKSKDTNVKSVSTDNWFAALKYDYFFTPKWYGYANARVEKDRIANLDIRFTPGVGVGYQWVETDKAKFDTEAGISWVYENYTTSPESNQEFSARLAYHLKYKINDKVSLFHNMEVFPSVEDLSSVFLNSDAGIRTEMTKKIFAMVKVEWSYDSTPAPGSYKNDERLVLALGYQF